MYLKPYENEDMSAYVKKVQFKLHESYANPNRIVSKPPYEVSETGWGEFEVQIKIHFADAAGERPVTFYHVLKLFHGTSGSGGSGGPSSGGSPSASSASASNPSTPDPSTTTSSVVQGRKTVVSECYDELVFQDPTQYVHALLTTTRALTLHGAHKHETDFEERRRRTEEAIAAGSEKVKGEIADFKERLELARITTEKFKVELARAKKAKAME